MLNNLTTKQILDLAKEFDAIEFAEKIAALEREACARIAEDHETWESNPAINIVAAILDAEGDHVR